MAKMKLRELSRKVVDKRGEGLWIYLELEMGLIWYIGCQRSIAESGWKIKWMI